MNEAKWRSPWNARCRRVDATFGKRVAFAGLAAIAATAAITGLAASAAEPVPAHLGEWNFRALLDGKSIGEHRFTVTADGDDLKVVSTASFNVKFMMITAYRYRHQATEHWRGNCLDSMSASTDDDGKPSRVQATRDGDSVDVTSPTGTQKLSGCVMSFAYWNPDIKGQTSLLNAQTGRYESVRVEALGSGDIDVRGKKTAALQFRITGPAQPINVWYSQKGDWLGLDSTVAGGRTLSYRLE